MTRFDIEASVGFLIAKAYQRLFASFRQRLEPYGVTPQQFALLAFLWKQDGLSQAELSEDTEIDRTTLSGMVDRLEKQGLVERCSQPGDRRVCLVQLSEAGRKMEQVLVPLSLEVRKRFSQALKPGEYEQLCQLLAKFREVPHV